LLSPWLSLEEIVREFLRARHDPQLLQVWVNTTLGEPFDGGVEKIEAATLIGRGENYGPQSIPDAVLFLVAGVDVQVNRLECQVLGFGANEECWAVSYDIIRGDPQHRAVWDELDELLLEKFQTDHGRELRIKATCIDSGGHATAQVMRFALARFARRVYAVKGAPGPKPSWPRKESRSKKNAGSLFIVGVDTAKDAIYGRLTITRPGPGRIHFPVGAPFDQQYFDQLTSEQVQTKFKDGRPVRVWVLPNGRRNESLDTFTYALCARYSLRVRLDKPLAQAPTAAVPSPSPPLAEAEPEPTPVPPPREETPQPFRPVIRHSHFQQQQSGGWMGGRRGSWWDRR